MGTQDSRRLDGVCPALRGDGRQEAWAPPLTGVSAPRCAGMKEADAIAVE